MKLLILALVMLFGATATSLAGDGRNTKFEGKIEAKCLDDCPASQNVSTPYLSNAPVSTCEQSAFENSCRPKLLGKVRGAFSNLRPKSLFGRLKCNCGN